jgi:acyl-CoA thioesterase I
MKISLAPLASLLAFSVIAIAQTAPTSRPVIKVACVGDSITFGVGVKDRKADAYPAQLQRLLGDTYEVNNYGVSGTTALSNSNRPYINTRPYKLVQEHKPDIVVMMLGTNDSKHPTTQFADAPNNWANKADFVRDYRAILAAFRAANPDVKLFVATPVPAYSPGMGSINAETIHDEIVPMVRDIAAAEHATVIDLHAALSDQPEKFPDRVHPNEAGAKAIAEAVYAALVAPTSRPVERVTR